MRTVKEVSDLTGVSVRTLQYYDEIGLLPPTQLTDAGYRLYDDEALSRLQQILFFKELDFPLKGIREILENPAFDKLKAYHQQKLLLESKKERLGKLIQLLERLEKGEDCMSFEAFDLSGVFETMEQFRQDYPEYIRKNWGSMEEYDEWMEKFRERESLLAEYAVKNYGSIEKYTESMKQNLYQMPEMSQKAEAHKKDGFFERNKELSDQLMSDITRDYTSSEIQAIVAELVSMTEELYEGMNMNPHFWENMCNDYLTNEVMISAVEKNYGKGASEFAGRAYEYYLKNTGRIK